VEGMRRTVNTWMMPGSASKYCWSLAMMILVVLILIYRPSTFVRSEEGAKTQKRVWSELNAKLEKIQPGILSNI
jgi:hypothetical protein